MSGALELQKAIRTKLLADAPLAALLADDIDIAGSPGIYDAVPQIADTGKSTLYPYCTIGDDELTEFGTETESGAEVDVTIHTWSRERGRWQVKQIQGALRDALDRVELSLTTWTFIGMDWVFEDSFMDSDGLTYHGVTRFRAFIDKAA